MNRLIPVFALIISVFILTFSAFAACPTVDNIDFLQESICDGVDMVEVCYEVTDTDGDSIFVEFSLNTGDTTINLSTTYEDVPGYYGPQMGWVAPGMHCFNWDVGTDLPDIEGCSYQIEIDIFNETIEVLSIRDSIPWVDLEGITYDGDNLWLMGSIFGGTSSSLAQIDPETHAILHTCTIDRDGGWADCCWHDGLIYAVGATGGGVGTGVQGRIFAFDPWTCAVVDSSIDPIFTGRFGQGIEYHDGWFWLNNTLGEVWRVDPVTLAPDPATAYMNVTDIYAASHGGADLFPDGLPDALEIELGSMWFLKNPDGGTNNILFRFDMAGNFIGEYILPTSETYGPEGLTFDGSCFWYTDHRSPIGTEGMAYRVCLWGCEESDYYTGCIDTRTPEVTATCTYDSLFPGTIYNFEWDVDDYFEAGECSVYVDWCTGSAGFEVSGFPPYDWDYEIPVDAGSCDSIRFVYRGMDEYCHRAEDTCRFAIGSGFEVTHIGPFPTDSGFYACDDQPIEFVIVSTCPVNVGGSYITIDGSDTYYLDNPAITWITSEYLSLNPGAGYWTSGTHTYTAHFEDGCGNSYDSTFTVLFDVDPPYFGFWGPVDTLAPEESTTVWFSVDDDLSGIGDINVRVTNDCGTFIYTFMELGISGDTLYTPEFMCPGTNHVCIIAEDIPDYCPPNQDSVCFEFEVPFAGGIFANVSQTIDRNGDGLAVTACDDQRLGFRIESEYPIDSVTIEIEVCGITIGWPSSMLSFSGDTLYYTPDTLWRDGALCSFCLNAISDIYGTALDAPVCGNVVVDLAPPYLVGAVPAIGDTIFGESAAISASFGDLVCTTAEVVSYNVTAPLSGISYDGTMFPVDLVGLVSGDVVSICTEVRDICADYCEVNDTTICWSYPVLIGDVHGWVVNPVDDNGDGRVISACSTGVITIGLLSNIDPSRGLRLTVDETGTSYCEGDLTISTSGDTTFVTLDPGVLGFDWAAWDGEYVHFELDSAFDVYGFTLSTPVRDSFLVDLSGPVLGMPGPVGEIHDTEAWIYTEFQYDSVCGNVDLDSIIAVEMISGTRYSFAADSGLVTGLANGDSVHVCAYASDGCQDYCGPNSTEFCWDFRVSIGSITADILSPVDDNGDSRVITTCSYQSIVWHIGHTDSMVASEFYVTVDGTEYNWPDHLEWRNDSLIFTPTEPWTHLDSIFYCIEDMEDMTGTSVSDVGCGSFILDLEPPEVFVDIGPTDGDVLTETSVVGSFYARDGVCGDTYIDSIRFTTTVSGIDGESFEEFYEIEGLVDGDTVHVCAYSSDHCEDYTCLDTVGMLCLELYVRMGTVTAEVIRPVDTNGDGRVVSSCEDNLIRWQIFSDYAIVESTITVEIEGVLRTYPDHLSWDGTYLTFSSVPSHPSGDIVEFCIAFIEDEAGGRLTDFCSSYIVDREPPYMESYSPISVAYSDSVMLNASFIDDICDSNIVIEGAYAIATPSGVYAYSTEFPFALAGLIDGDSVIVCADVRDGCSDYCHGNQDTICFSFNVAMGEPLAEIIAPRDANADGRRVTACDDQGVVIRLSDSHGMRDTGIGFDVDGMGFTEFDLSPLFFDPDSTTLYGTWTPPGTWSHGDWVVVDIHTAENRLGDPLTITATDSFLVDIEGPEISYTGPTGTHISDAATISAAAIDDICGTDIVLDSMTIDITPSGIHVNRGGSWSDTTLAGLVSGETVTVCMFARDNCADTCGYNSSDTCITFDVLVGSVTASILEPRDLNGDSRIITTCADQEIRWLISHSLPIVGASIEVAVDGIGYDIDDPELSMSGDTLIFASTWADGDSIPFSLDELCDTLGTCISSPVSGWMLVDLSPPGYTDLLPPTGGFMARDTTITFTMTLFDSICPGEDFLDSLLIDLRTETDMWHVGYPDLPVGPVTWTDLESLHVCIYLQDRCSDYCAPNDTFYCWEYTPYTGAPIGEFVLPRDINGDGVRISACGDQGVRFVVRDPAGLSGTGIIFSVDGTPYTETDASISFIDTATMVIDWVPGTDWESGDSVHVLLTDAPNVHGVSLASPVEGFFIVDTEPPVIEYSGPTGTITADSFSYSFAVWDSVCEDANIDSVLLTGPSGTDLITENGTITGLSGGDTITICLYATDGCADTCGFNSSEMCISVDIELGDVVAHVVNPGGIPGMAVSACDDQELRWVIEHELDLDESTIEVTVDGTPFDTGDRQLELWNDTLTFSPDAPDFWTDGDMVIYCLNHAMDITGADIPAPVCDTILFDLSPPQFSDYRPSGIIDDLTPEITTLIADIYSGVDSASLSITLDGESIPFDWDGVRLTTQPAEPLDCGVPHHIVIRASDTPDLCDANSDSLMMTFIVDCLPNLIVDSAWVDPPEIVEGDSAWLFGELRNGDIPLSTFNIGVFMGDDEWDFLNYNDVSADWTGQYAVWFGGWPEGEYTICITADPYEWTDETDETDNTACTVLRILGSGCDVHPNPFTPNADGIYDEAAFEHPGQADTPATVRIFDMDYRFVAELEGLVPKWDGRDQEGNPMPKGVYVYVLYHDGDELKCQGTIYLAR